MKIQHKEADRQTVIDSILISLFMSNVLTKCSLRDICGKLSGH